LRTFLVTAVVSLALAPAALAQSPVPPTQPPPPTNPTPPPAQPVPAGISVRVGSGVHSGKRIYTVAGENVTVIGRIAPQAAGEQVTVELFKGGKRVTRRHAKVGKDGMFKIGLRARKAGAYNVRARHKNSPAVSAGKSKRKAFIAINGSAGMGSKGTAVRLLQQQLGALAYATPHNGHFDAATGRAVLAFRKVNRLSRTQSANRDVFARLFAGQGGFQLRHPGAGKHVEADLGRQVVVLAQNGRPYRIYHMSSGKPSTPTVVGTFRFYSKTIGTNRKGMVDSNYFIRGYAIHGYAEVPAYAASHGCIRVPIPNALAIFRWIRLGDQIFVYR
jgi:hypothetical protein